MMKSKKSVIVISSESSFEYSEIVQEYLEKTAYITLERQILNKPMEHKLQKILKLIDCFDYCIIILGLQDFCEKNLDIIFLIGLFTGNMTLNRISILVPKEKEIGDLTSYLNGFEPNCYDNKIENKRIAIGQCILNVKYALNEISNKISKRDYIDLENKKELLRIALECYGEYKDRYNPFLAKLMEVFNLDVGLKKSKVIGATIFALKEDCLEQVGTVGIKANHKFSLQDKNRDIVKCHLKNELLLGEKLDRFFCEREFKEYIYYTPLINNHVLAVHIKCVGMVFKGNNEKEKILMEIENRNAGYIFILQLFLKGGIKFARA